MLILNNQSFRDVNHDDAVTILKNTQQFDLVLRYVGKVPHSSHSMIKLDEFLPSDIMPPHQVCVIILLILWGHNTTIHSIFQLMFFVIVKNFRKTIFLLYNLLKSLNDNQDVDTIQTRPRTTARRCCFTNKSFSIMAEIIRRF